MRFKIARGFTFSQQKHIFHDRTNKCFEQCEELCYKTILNSFHFFATKTLLKYKKMNFLIIWHCKESHFVRPEEICA